MIVSAIDVESTGLNVAEDRIIEICLKQYDLKTKFLLNKLITRINPQGRIIDAKAALVHKITAISLIGQPYFHQVAPRIESLLASSDLLIGHNILSFDGPILVHEFMRCGIEPPKVDLFDTMLEARWATPMGKKPSMKELCYALDIHYDETTAHAAEYDVDRMMDCVFRGIEWGGFKIERAT